jgi:hypothetical protein
MTSLPRYSDRAFAIDAAAIAVISVAICTLSDRLTLMTALIPAVVAVRFLAWAHLEVEERGPWGAELALFALCIGIGAFNDWNSVVRHRIYDYSVPVYYPERTTIPIWMLIYWGLILRFLITLFRWRRFDPGQATTPWARILFLMTLVVTTRQAIYQWYDEPILSWVPFAAALVLYAVVARPGRTGRVVAVLFAVGGPLVEVAYIQLGHLHHYRLGWLGGVPVWIALWWVLAALIWMELSAPLQRWLLGHVGRARRSAPAPLHSH